VPASFAARAAIKVFFFPQKGKPLVGTGKFGFFLKKTKNIGQKDL
jgi:hypothetical protein